MEDFVIPAQFRAGRALLDWSQENVAKSAKVGIGSVRDLESQKRPVDSVVANAVRRALVKAGITFVAGDAALGPGVRLADNRPYLVRRPTVVTKWEGVPFEVELRGKVTTVFVPTEVLADLESLTGNPTDEALLRAFESNHDRILNAVAIAMWDRENFDRQGRLFIRGKDIFGPPITPNHGIQVGHDDQFSQLTANKWVQLWPLPKRIWQGEEQEQVDDRWLIQSVDTEKGRIVIRNSRTDHFLPLYRAHIQRFVPESQVNTVAPVDGRLELTVQIVFEDGHARLE